MERRKFITTSCNVCLLAATGYLVSGLSSCSPAYPVFSTEIINDEIQLPLSSLVSPNLQLIRPKGWLYDIALQKKADATYEALLLKCTHQDNQLSPSGNRYTCRLHGSQFDKDGRVIKGPAEHPLKQFRTSVNQDKLIIHTQS
jgi:nitrite reductase/ring-hydroxylating ferredoxin subunit